MPAILVVDDEPLIRKMLTLILEHEGFIVFTAANGLDAINSWKEHGDQVDLVLSDIAMPGMDGLTLAMILSSEHPTVAVLLMSGCCEGIDLSSRPKIRFLPKPLDLTRLLSTIHSLVNEKIAAAAA